MEATESFSTSTYAAPVATAWYRWTTPSDWASLTTLAGLKVTTIHASTSFDTILDVIYTTTVNPVVSSGTFKGHSDNFNGTLQSTALIARASLTASTTYYFRVGGASGSAVPEGSFVLSWSTFGGQCLPAAHIPHSTALAPSQHHKKPIRALSHVVQRRVDGHSILLSVPTHDTLAGAEPIAGAFGDVFRTSIGASLDVGGTCHGCRLWTRAPMNRRSMSQCLSC